MGGGQGGSTGPWLWENRVTPKWSLWSTEHKTQTLQVSGGSISIPRNPKPRGGFTSCRSNKPARVHITNCPTKTPRATRASCHFRRPRRAWPLRKKSFALSNERKHHAPRAGKTWRKGSGNIKGATNLLHMFRRFSRSLAKYSSTQVSGFRPLCPEMAGVTPD